MRTIGYALIVLAVSSTARGQIFQEADGVLVMEAESTKSPPGLWKGKRAIKDYTGQGYIEFTGNKPPSGKPNSPLVYPFQITKPGLYYLHMRASREDHGQPKDHSNDCYVRVAGKYGAGPNPGNAHGKDAPLLMLQQDTKFFGGGFKTFAWFSGNHLDPGGHNNKRVAVYNFQPGRYALIVSGRSQYFCLDRIAFRHADVASKVVEDLMLDESRIAD